MYNKPLGTTFTDDPIPPQFVHLFNSSQEKQNCTVAEIFLTQQGRRMESVLGDGNCLFRAISFAIHESQDMHIKIREDIVETVRSNKQKFKSFIIGPHIHISNMSKLGTWGLKLN